MKKELLSTAIAYANGKPHIGHAFEFVLADTITRLRRLQNRDVFFVTGMDEHGQKIEGKAKDAGLSPRDYIEQYATEFKKLDAHLSVEPDFFVRTSDAEKHYIGAQYLWNKLADNGYLEKRMYTGLYCVGCESFKTETELNEKGECPDHLKKPEIVEEENYFFLLSRFTEQIRSAIESNEMRIIPDIRRNEIVSLLKIGLQDVSFSRPKTKVSWGIPVPHDEEHNMYVWCDALSNYITAIGYGTPSFDEDRAQHMTHVIGKDILRFHAAIWPGMLLAAGLSLPKEIIVHGHITSGGHKMSKSLGNVIDPETVLAEFAPKTSFGGEALRFVLLHEIPSQDDGDITMDSIRSSYTAHLVNGIGNLTSRILKMSTVHGIVFDTQVYGEWKSTVQEKFEMADTSEVQVYVRELMKYARNIDTSIAENEPFKVIKTDTEKGKLLIADLLYSLMYFAEKLGPCMPDTSEKIISLIHSNTIPETPLFGRLS